MNNYDDFVKSALNAGFTDPQVNWLEHYLYNLLPKGEEKSPVN